jgi:phosphate:Na+ symporter
VQIIDSVRSEAATSVGAERASLARAGSELGAVINGFLGELIDGELSGESAARLLVLDRRQDHLQALLDTTGEIASCAAAARLSDQPAAVLDRLKESLSLIFLSTQDAWNSRDTTDIDLLLRMTADRGDLMERLRRSLTGSVVDNAEASTLFYATSLFERAVWLVRQIGLTLHSADASPA